MRPGSKQDKYNLLFEHMPDALAYQQVVTDQDGRPVDFILVDVNPAFEKVIGLRKEKIVGKTVRQVLPGIEYEDFDWIGTCGKVARTGKAIRFQEYSRTLGRFFDVSAYSNSPGYITTILHEPGGMYDAGTAGPSSEGRAVIAGQSELICRCKRGNITEIQAVGRDVTALKEAEQRLQFQLQFEKLVSDISSYFVRLPSQDLDQGINYALEVTGKFFQVDRSYVILFSEDNKTMDLTHEWYREGLWPEAPNFVHYPFSRRPWWYDQIKRNRLVYIDDVENLPPDAEREKQELRDQNTRSLLCVPIMQSERVTGVLGFDSIKKTIKWSEDHIALLNIISELFSNAFARKISGQKIRFLSFYDQLTGLYNRSYMEEEMKRLDTERQMPISVIMADLNGLKLLNDSYGHATGDEILMTAAEIFRESCRQEDIVARWGGDEFVLLLPRTTPSEAETICRRILENCRSRYVEELPISISMGVASKRSTDKTMNEVLSEAEDRMYKKKLVEGKQARRDVIAAMCRAVEKKSFETGSHVQEMQKMARLIGEGVNLTEKELGRLDDLLVIHDIGMINIPREILNKQGPLNEGEWNLVKKHPETGFRIARAIEEFAHTADDILSHHEHYDGSGYPLGLKGEEISLLARITAIVDAYNVMKEGRPYRKAASIKEIKAEFRICSGSQFDPELVELFLGIIDRVEIAFESRNYVR